MSGIFQIYIYTWLGCLFFLPAEPFEPKFSVKTHMAPRKHYNLKNFACKNNYAQYA